jgi:hypothetical protein
MTKKKKVEAGHSIAKLVMMEVYEVEKKENLDRHDHICSRGYVKQRIDAIGQLPDNPFIFVLNIQMPGDPPVSVVSYYMIPSDLKERMTQPEDLAFLNCLDKFLDMPRNERDRLAAWGIHVNGDKDGDSGGAAAAAGATSADVEVPAGAAANTNTQELLALREGKSRSLSSDGGIFRSIDDTEEGVPEDEKKARKAEKAARKAAKRAKREKDGKGYVSDSGAESGYESSKSTGKKTKKKKKSKIEDDDADADAEGIAEDGDGSKKKSKKKKSEGSISDAEEVGKSKKSKSKSKSSKKAGNEDSMASEVSEDGRPEGGVGYARTPVAEKRTTVKEGLMRMSGYAGGQKGSGDGDGDGDGEECAGSTDVPAPPAGGDGDDSSEVDRSSHDRSSSMMRDVASPKETPKGSPKGSRKTMTPHPTAHVVPSGGDLSKETIAAAVAAARPKNGWYKSGGDIKWQEPTAEGVLPLTDFRNKRFKLIPSIVDGPWVVKMAVG